jgi:hypothetical protein
MSQRQEDGISGLDPNAASPGEAAEGQRLAHERERALERLRSAWWVRLGSRLGLVEIPGPGKPPPPPPDAERVRKWRLSVSGSSIAQLVFPPHDVEMVRVAITKAGWRNSWDIQLNRAGGAIVAGQRYGLCFQARADRRRTMIVGVAQSESPWNGLGLFRTVGLGPEWQYFREEFTATAGEDHARIHFDLGGASVPVELTNVHLAPADADGPPAAMSGRQGK